MSTEEAPAYREAWVPERRPVRVGGRLLIGPPGTRADAEASDCVIELEFAGSRAATGVVFGTGEHATTRLALVLLEEHLRAGDRVLDIGTGSGVLAIAAARFGAAEVVAIDNDPPAARAAASNVRRNGVEPIVRVIAGGLDEVEQTRFNLAVANILTPVIRDLAGGMHCRLRSDGLLLVSGVIAAEVEDARQMFRDAGFEIHDERGEGDWRAFVLAPR